MESMRGQGVCFSSEKVQELPVTVIGSGPHLVLMAIGVDSVHCDGAGWMVGEDEFSFLSWDIVFFVCPLAGRCY